MDPETIYELREDGALLHHANKGEVRKTSRWPLRNLCTASSFLTALGLAAIFAITVVAFVSYYSRLKVTPLTDYLVDAPHHNGSARPAAEIYYKHSTNMLPPSDQFDLGNGDFPISSLPTIREYVFNITRDVGDPDGVRKSMILINGQSPGPTVEANSGDTIRVVVHNSMREDTTTIHWHGIDQKNTVWMDGVDTVTQCGIPPGESFTYEFQVQNQRGSFWYHAHVSVQYTDGLYGPLIIHDPDERVPRYDADKIILIGDLHHMTGNEALSEYFSPSPSWSPGMKGFEPPPDNIVINGRNGFNCSNAASPMGHGAHGSTSHGAHGGASPRRRTPSLATCKSGSLYTTRIQSRQRVRLRIISHSSNLPLWFTVDEHPLEIVEIDGVEIEPVVSTRIFLTPGQRYSAILTADRPAGNYRLRASAARRCAMLDDRPGSAMASVGFEALGVLQYDDAEVEDGFMGHAWDLEGSSRSGLPPDPWTRPCQDLPFDMAKPKKHINAYDVGERNHHHFTFEMREESDGYYTYINGSTFTPTLESAILWNVPGNGLAAGEITSNLSSWDYGVDQHVYISRDVGKAAQVAISSLEMMEHPWHLHGQNFQIVGWGKGRFGQGATSWHLENPLRRDTVTVPAHSHVVIRYLTANPGVWALHCHIQWHAEGGMFITMAHGLDDLHKLIESQADIRNKFCTAPTPKSSAHANALTE